MFCPKCSQSQPSDEMRFCSRCGFLLETVSVLLSHDGTLPQVQAKAGRLSTRSRMATESLILTILSWIIGLICTAFFDVSGVVEWIAKGAALTFFLLGFIGLFRFLYAFLFLKIDPVQASEFVLPKEPVRSSLPPAQSTPISDWPLRSNTREMVKPVPSVTENTTRLLDDESS